MSGIKPVSTPSPNPHLFTVRSMQSFGETTDLLDLAMELADRLEGRIARLVLGDLHVRSLQTLRQNVHDLGRDIPNVVVPHVDLTEHAAQPLKTLLDVGLETGSDGSRDGEGNEWRDLLEVGGIDANEEPVEDLGLTVRRDPLMRR